MMLNSKMMNNFDELVEDDGADSKAIDKICSPEDSMAAFTAGFGAALVATFGVVALGVAALSVAALDVAALDVAALRVAALGFAPFAGFGVAFSFEP